MQHIWLEKILTFDFAESTDAKGLSQNIMPNLNEGSPCRGRARA